MIVRVPWSLDAEKGLKISAGPDMAEIRQEVNSGVSELFKVDRQDAKGYIVTRIEQVEHGQELVMVLAEGRGFNVMLPIILKTAKGQGFVSVRGHVKRLGLVRMYQSFGFVTDEVHPEENEYVMRYFF